jgi:ubiquitin-activating enzyme E1
LGGSGCLFSVPNIHTYYVFSGAQERLPKKVSDLARDVAKMVVPPSRKHFDIVVACEDEDDDENDLDVPLVSIKFR